MRDRYVRFFALPFLTSFPAIVAAGLIVFAVMGYNRAAIESVQSGAHKWTVAVVVVSAILISVPLGITSYRVATSRLLAQRAEAAASEWLEGSDCDIFSVKAEDGTVDMITAGEGPLPEFDELLAELGTAAGRTKVKLKVVPERTFSGTARP